jgi:hypothetical protein
MIVAINPRSHPAAERRRYIMAMLRYTGSRGSAIRLAIKNVGGNVLNQYAVMAQEPNVATNEQIISAFALYSLGWS